MTTHLNEIDIIDALDGAAPASASAHLQGCGACRERLDDLTACLQLARSADVPEPPGMYWEAFRRQVGRRLDTPAPSPWRRFGFLGALAAAAVLVVAVVNRPVEPPAAPLAPVAGIPAWTPLPPADDDPGLAVLGALPVADNGAAEAQCVGLGDCLNSLSDDESAALAPALEAALKGGRS